MTGTTVRSSLAGTAVALRGARGASHWLTSQHLFVHHLTRRASLAGAATRTATSLQLEPSGHTSHP